MTMRAIVFGMALIGSLAVCSTSQAQTLSGAFAINPVQVGQTITLTFTDTTGNGYQAEALPGVPTSLPEAIALFEASSFARAAFGDDVVEHLLHFARTEGRASERAVTDVERARYFERI